MVNLLNAVPVSLVSGALLGKPNRPVVLYRGRMELRGGGLAYSGRGTVRFEYLPSPRIAFRMVANQMMLQPVVDLIPSDAELSLRSPQTPIPVVISGTTLGAKTVVSGRIKGRTSIGIGNDMRRLGFRLINFHEYVGGAVKLETRIWLGRLVLQDGTYVVTIDAAPDLVEVVRILRNIGGYAVTHIGEVKRVDGLALTPAEATDVVEALFWLFSFARGGSSPPALPVGFNSQLKRVWREWLSPRATAWRGNESWFDPTQASALADIFTPFMSLWGDSTMREVLTSVIHWYIEANTNAGGVEGAIVLTQAALELLATVIMVERDQVFSAATFDRYNAERRLTELLDYCRIPSGPSFKLASYPVLQDFTGPGVIVRLRNALVHSKQAKRIDLRNFPFDLRYDAVTLGLWYVELILLWLLDFKGRYSNRLSGGHWAGQVETVPWVP